jgi:hypothetical protein
VFKNQSEGVEMSRGTSCFDLFSIFANAVGLSGQRIGRVVSEESQAIVWLAFCDENRAQHHEQQRGSRGVTKARPVEVRELSIVKSCKRKVRW